MFPMTETHCNQNGFRNKQFQAYSVMWKTYIGSDVCPVILIGRGKAIIAFTLKDKLLLALDTNWKENLILTVFLSKLSPEGHSTFSWPTIAAGPFPYLEVCWPH